MSESKRLSEYTDREVLEIAVRNAKEAAKTSRWIRRYLIIATVIVTVYIALRLLMMMLPLLK